MGHANRICLECGNRTKERKCEICGRRTEVLEESLTMQPVKAYPNNFNHIPQGKKSENHAEKSKKPQANKKQETVSKLRNQILDVAMKYNKITGK